MFNNLIDYFVLFLKKENMLCLVSKFVSVMYELRKFYYLKNSRRNGSLAINSHLKDMNYYFIKKYMVCINGYLIFLVKQ